MTDFIVFLYNGDCIGTVLPGVGIWKMCTSHRDRDWFNPVTEMLTNLPFAPAAHVMRSVLTKWVPSCWIAHLLDVPFPDSDTSMTTSRASGTKSWLKEIVRGYAGYLYKFIHVTYCTRCDVTVNFMNVTSNKFCRSNTVYIMTLWRRSDPSIPHIAHAWLVLPFVL